MAEQRSYRQQGGVALGRPLSRRDMLLRVALGGAGLATATAIGCRRGEKAPAAQAVPAAKQPKRGGVLRHKSGYETQGAGFDPHVLSFTFSESYSLFYQRLVGYAAGTYELQPELAQKWEQPSDVEFIFTLQPGVRWHNKPPANGRELTAADVVFSLERIRTDDPKFVQKSTIETVDKVQAMDKSRVKLTLKQPDAPLLSNLAGDAMVVMAPEVVEKAAGKFATADAAVGTGPFILTLAEENVRSEFVRNPDYWKPGLPYLDAIHGVHFADDQLAWAAFLAGQLDVVARVPGTEVKSFIAQQGKDYTPSWFFSPNMVMMYPNVQRKPMDDLRVTKALRLLIDPNEHIKAVAEVYYGRGMYGFIHSLASAAAGWDLTQEEYARFFYWKESREEATREALALLNAVGFSQQNPLKFEFVGLSYTTEGKQSTELIQAQWRRFSQGIVQAEIKPGDLPTQNRVRASGDFTYIHAGSVGGAPDPNPALIQAYRTGGSRNFSRWSDPKADAMIDKQRTIYNITERKALIRELTLYMMDRYPGTVVYHSLWLNGAKPYVRGVRAERVFYGAQYEQVWLDI